jgi:hypothetical protein
MEFLVCLKFGDFSISVLSAYYENVTQAFYHPVFYLENCFCEFGEHILMSYNAV